ncbi:MAG: hypothetical protein ACLUFF_01730 [Acutalibacteraceae bacterium]
MKHDDKQQIEQHIGRAREDEREKGRAAVAVGAQDGGGKRKTTRYSGGFLCLTMFYWRLKTEP